MAEALAPAEQTTGGAAGASGYRDDVAKFTDFKGRDGKKNGYDGLGGFVKFLAAVLVKLPLLLVGVPVGLLTVLVGKLIPGGKKEPSGPKIDTAIDPVEPAKDRLPLSERSYDLVLFGATGFTGGLAADYLARQYGDDESLRWAIAGRSQGSLERTRQRLAGINPRMADLPLIVADSSKPESIVAMAADTKVVATTVGPFAAYGTPLVRACVSHGTSYVDITGEAGWVRQLIEAYTATTKETGAMIINMCGHDCVPWDLTALELSNKTQSVDPEENLVSLEIMDDIEGTVSGGTLATVLYSLSGDGRMPRSKLGFNPMDMSMEGSRAEERIADRSRFGIGYSSRARSFFGAFVMANVNRECVRRSNVLNHYAPRLAYKEQLQLPGPLSTITWLLSTVLTGLVVAIPAFRSVAFATGALPKPGQGPTVRQQEDGYLIVTAYGTGSKGTKTKSKLYFPRDAGYRDTARMLVESGLSIALQSDDLPMQCGVVSPAAGLGTVLRDRLCATGCEMEVQIEK